MNTKDLARELDPALGQSGQSGQGLIGSQTRNPPLGDSSTQERSPMNTKDLARELDALAESVRGLAAEDAQKRDRVRVLLHELGSLAAGQLTVNEHAVDSWLYGDRAQPEWKADARRKAYELLQTWFEEHGLT